MACKHCYVAAVLNNRPYTNDIALFHAFY